MNEKHYRLATFVALVIVMLTTMFAAAMNWLAFEHRTLMFEQMAELARRVEVVERMTDKQTPPPPRQREHQ